LLRAYSRDASNRDCFRPAPDRAPVVLAQHFVDAGDGIRLWYSDSGMGSPVIVIHGGPGIRTFSSRRAAGDRLPRDGNVPRRRLAEGRVK
jgi:hypothetical protein